MDDNKSNDLKITFEALANLQEQLRDTVSVVRSCVKSLSIPLATISASIRACVEFWNPFIQKVRAVYPPMIKRINDFNNIYSNIVTSITKNISIQNMLSELETSDVQSIFNVIEENDELSDVNFDTVSALYDDGEITDKDFVEEFEEMVYKRDFTPSETWDDSKKSKWFLAIRSLFLILIFFCSPVIEKAKDNALESFNINEFWEESGIYEWIELFFGFKSSAVSEQEAKDSVSQDNVGNISKKKREDLLQKIQEIRSYISAAPQDENTGNLLAYLSDLEKDVNGKKYGLVFEEHREEIDEVLDTHTPVLTEDKDLFIDNGGQMNFLIEGDNLAALKLLEKTHKGKIDLIYIDPPYNTGKNDFVYDDKFIVSEDQFKHSKYISFLKKRLEIMCKLLSPQGFICISIDDNEQANVRFLCDGAFGSENFISCMPRRTKSSGKTTNNISANHDYVLIYARNIATVGIVGIPHIDKGFKFEDEYVETRGKYKLNQTLDYDSLSYSAGLDYPIEINGRVFYPGSDYNQYLKRKSGEHQRADWAWRWSKDLFEFGYKNGFIVVKEKSDGTARIYTKTYLNATIKRNINGNYEVVISKRKKPLSTLEFLDAEYSNDNAKKDLKQIFKSFAFDYPKPLSLLKKLVQICYSDSAIVLDCFAGSGTTGHAVMKLNAEDGGNRRFILCTNNENNICRDVTYERIKRVIDKENYAASLKYYKVDYLPIDERMYYEYADELLNHIRELVELENGMNFIGNAEIGIVLTEDELEAFMSDTQAFSKCKKLYMGHDILPSQEQEKVLQENGVEISIIPDYYYRDLQER